MVFCEYFKAAEKAIATVSFQVRYRGLLGDGFDGYGATNDAGDMAAEHVSNEGERS